MLSWLFNPFSGRSECDGSTASVVADNELGWNELLDQEKNILVLTGRNGKHTLDTTLEQEVCSTSRIYYNFTHDVETNEEVQDIRACGTYNIEHLERFLWHQQSIVKSFDIPPTVLILDESVSIEDPFYTNLLKNAKLLRLTVIVVIKDLTRIRPALLKLFDKVILCRCQMTRKERKQCFEHLTRKVKMPASTSIQYLEKATSARRFRKGRHAAVITHQDGLVSRIPLSVATCHID